MRHLWLPAVLLFIGSLAWGQGVAAYNGQCAKGGQSILYFSQASTGTQPIGGGTVSTGTGAIGSFPKCTVSVFFTGTLNLAPIYSNPSLGSLANPFTANADGSFLFFATIGAGYDITMSGGGLPVPVTLTDVFTGGGSGAGTGGVTGIVGGNPVSFLNPVGGFQDQGSQVFNVKAYGAVGNKVSDDSVPINTAISSAAINGGRVLFPPGNYAVGSPINGASFVSLVGSGPPGSAIISALSTMSPQLNVVQFGYNSQTCTQAFGTVTVTGTNPAVLTLPVANVIATATTITASSVLSGTNVIATFSGTFGGATGTIPVAQQTLTGTSFSVAGYNSTWTVISATSSQVVAYQTGGSSFGAATGGTLSLAFSFPAMTGTWVNQYVFVGGAQYQITAQTSSSITLAGTYTGSTGAGITFQGVYSGCPIGFSVQNLTIDAGCGVSSSTGTPCNSGGRGTGAGHAIACRGCYRAIFRDDLFMHSPNDGLYTEGGLFVNNVIPPYSGGTANTFGLATTVYGDNLRFSEVSNNGVEHLGPSDGMFVNLVGSFSGGVGYRAACIPGSYGVCGNDTFLFGPHMYKTGSWDYQFLVEQFVNSAEAESSATNGAFSCDFQQDITNTSYCVLKANALVADNPVGDCLYLNSPSTSFTSTFAIANGITNLDCSGVVSGYGIHATTATGRSSITLANLSGPTNTSLTWTGCVYWPANSASLNDIRCVNPSGVTSAIGFDFSGATSLNRFIGRNLNAANFTTEQVKWPPAAVASQVDIFVAANSSQLLYCTAANACGVGIPSGLDVTLHLACNSCSDSSDPPISTVNAGFAPPLNIGSFPSCTALLGGNHLTANNCNSGCSAGGTCTSGGSISCEMYCKGSATSWLETGLTE